MNTHLLMIEDDHRLAQMVAEYLGHNGLQVAHQADGTSGLAQLQSPDTGSLPDLVILDLMLPDMDGLEVCRRIRALPGPAAQVPVLMLTAKGDPMDRIIGLELGADDYLPKPFSPRELAARAKALLRRSQLPRTTHSAPTGQGLEHDEAGQRILLHGQALALTRREYLLLAQLLAGAGRIHTREALLAAAWGDDSDSQDRTVDTHIKTLRAKLRELDPTRDYIRTHRGMGYCLDV